MLKLFHNFFCKKKDNKDNKFVSFSTELQKQWDQFCTDQNMRRNTRLGSNNYYDSVSSDISGSVPTIQLMKPKVDNIVELRHEPFCINVFGLVPRRGDLFVGFLLNDNGPYDSVQISFGDGDKNVRYFTLTKGQPEMVFKNSVIISRHIVLEVRVKPIEAEDYVDFIYGFVNNEYKKWFEKTTFVCPVGEKKWMVYPKDTSISYKTIDIKNLSNILFLNTPHTDNPQSS